MAKLKLASSDPAALDKLRDVFLKAASENGFINVNWTALIAWAEKYVPALFVPAIIDVISGNWSALFTLAASQGPQAIVELLAALGIALPSPVVTP